MQHNVTLVDYRVTMHIIYKLLTYSCLFLLDRHTDRQTHLYLAKSMQFKCLQISEVVQGQTNFV